MDLAKISRQLIEMHKSTMCSINDIFVKTNYRNKIFDPGSTKIIKLEVKDGK